ncbi:MAG TPA: sigma-70 family RNA polymerase sigma factor [Microlunatus sp.]|nr:sigma-70 family RNA polymerase sigma factor [Microlunatus sp.]
MPESGTPIVVLVEAARVGDEAAWSHLHARLTPVLHKVVAPYRLGETDAGDVIQMTWTKCVEHLPRLRISAALPGWLTTTCRNEAIQCLRRRARCVPVDYQDQVAFTPVTTAEPPIAGDPLTVLLQSETDILLSKILEELGPRDRHLMWALVDDLSYREIAEQFCMPVGSIGPTRQRIIAKLRRRVPNLDRAA